MHVALFICMRMALFCQYCGVSVLTDAKYCVNCGKGQGVASAAADGLANTPEFTSHNSSAGQRSSHAKEVKSFKAYRMSKGKQWKNIVSKKAPKNEPEKDAQVTCKIALYEWSEKEFKLKLKRGKRMSLSVSNSAPYGELVEKAVGKCKHWHSDCYDETKDYMLLLENEKEAQFLPGPNFEFFSLKRYKEELAKDYNKIVLYLCTRDDYHQTEDIETEDTETEDTEKELPNETDIYDPGPSSPKKQNLQAKDEDVQAQVQHDEYLARVLQEKLDNEVDISTTGLEEDNPNESNKQEEPTCTDIASLIKLFQGRVDSEGQFFLVLRRGTPFHRLLSLWQREAKKTSPAKLLRVKYSGEDGIDTGAISKEFLAKAIQDMGATMFPDGAPVDSMYNIQNGNLRSCGQIVATSLAQGGPAPLFLEDNAYNILVAPDVDITNLNLQEHFTTKDTQLLRSVEQDVHTYQDLITDHGYTGIINDAHKEAIIGTIMVSIISRRLLYWREFCEGLMVYGILSTIRENPELCKPLFVQPDNYKVVDANYVFSIMKPTYSREGTSKRSLEDSVMDNFQDFLNSLEDEAITGYSEAVIWDEDDAVLLGETSKPVEMFERADLTPAGILGWLTGQRHKPLNGDMLSVGLNFDHDCMTQNPHHTICFPRVAACARELTLPVVHMVDSKEFRNVFLLAYCKGNAFANA